MKWIPVLACILLSFGLLFHSGRTDEDGGHTDSSTGEYHYHHGHPAHQHPNGVCPYGDYKTQKPTTAPIATKSPSSSTQKSQPTQIPVAEKKNSSESDSKEESKGLNGWEALTIIGAPCAVLLTGTYCYRKIKKKD